MLLHVRAYVRAWYVGCVPLDQDEWGCVTRWSYQLLRPKLCIALHAASPETRPDECEIASFALSAHRAELLAHRTTTLFARAIERASDLHRRVTFMSHDARIDDARDACSEDEYASEDVDLPQYAMWEIFEWGIDANEWTAREFHALGRTRRRFATESLNVARDALNRELARRVCAPGGELSAWSDALRSAAHRARREIEELYCADAQLARALRRQCGIAVRSGAHWLAPSREHVLAGWRL